MSQFSFEVCRSAAEFNHYAQWTDYVRQYAVLSADDWMGGFADSLRDDTAKIAAFGMYTGLLKDPETPIFNDFKTRIGNTLDADDQVVFAYEWDRDMTAQSVAGVARGRLYRPRNPFKTTYAYFPDFFMNSRPGPIHEQLVLNAIHLFGQKRLVVDAFVDNTQHREDLENLGFVSLGEKGRHDWEAPDALKWILGATYPVQQYELVA